MLPGVFCKGECCLWFDECEGIDYSVKRPEGDEGEETCCDQDEEVLTPLLPPRFGWGFG